MLSLPIRRLIYLAFIGLFCITAPILVLYTAGYRYNFKKNVIQKVGSFSVKPMPKEADIYLNNQLQTGLRPDDTLHINNLIPGKYKVTVALEGYHSWEKNLETFSNTNTFVNNATLFKQNIPENIVGEKIDQAIISPDAEKISYLSDNQLLVLNLNNWQITEINSKVNSLQIISWSKNSDNLLVKNSLEQFVVYNLNNPKQPLPINMITPALFNNINWDPEVDYLLYGFADNAFYQINILTKTYRILHRFSKIINQSYGDDFFFANNEIYYTQNTPEGLFLEKIVLGITDKNKMVSQLMRLPSAGNFSFYPNHDGSICLMDKAKQKLYWINQDFTKINLEVEAKNFNWSNDGKKLLYYNDFEIWIYDLEKENSELITRYGQIIKQVEFLPKTEYLAYLVNGSLEIIELDSRDQRNVIELVASENTNDFYISPKSKNIFFTGKIGSQEGLYKLSIQ